MRRSLSGNLVLSTAVTLLIGMGFVLGAWALLSRYEPDWLRERDLEGMAQHVVAGMAFDASGRPTGVTLPLKLQQVFAALPNDFFFQVLDSEGSVLLSSNGSHAPAIVGDAPPASLLGKSRSTFAGLPRGMIVMRVQRNGGPYFVLHSRSDRFEEMLLANDIGNERFATLMTLGISMAVVAAVIFATMSRTLRQLRNISSAASRIDHVNLQSRLATDGVPRELTPLIDSFNGALERLETGFRIQQEFLATAAHELKTPLALVRGEIELRGATNKARILSDLDQMNRQVHQLLHLAEVSDISNLTLAAIDPCLVVQDVIVFMERLALERHVDIRIDCPAQPVTIAADGSALFVLVRNLVENAVHHAPAKSVIMVCVNAGGIDVRDDGPGIPHADLPLLFNRFWRGAHRRDEGAGLGLSICSEIARGHGWQLTAANRVPSGAEFRVLFSCQT